MSSNNRVLLDWHLIPKIPALLQTMDRTHRKDNVIFLFCIIKKENYLVLMMVRMKMMIIITMMLKMIMMIIMITRLRMMRVKISINSGSLL